jgi:hypothetical protein
MKEDFKWGEHLYVAGCTIKAKAPSGEPLLTLLVSNLTDIALHAKTAIPCGDSYAEVPDHATQLRATVELLKLMQPPKKEPERAVPRQGEAEGGAG